MVSARALMGACGGAGTSTYGDLVESQGADHYWELQTALSLSATEADLITGNWDLTMTSGASTLAGEGPFSGSDSIALLEADTESVSRSSGVADLNQDWSTSVWVKMLTTSNANAVIMTLSGGGNYMMIIHRNDRSGLTIQFGSTAVFFDFGSGRNIENDGSWHHIGLTRSHSATASSDIFTTWLDGVQSSQASRATIGNAYPSSTAGIAIGNYSSLTLGVDAYFAHWAWAEGTVWGSTEFSAQNGYTP